MEAHPDIQALLQALREVLKAKGYTYRRLARELDVSEVTVKRVFAKGCSLDRIAVICERVGTSFLEVAALAKTDEEVNYFLTPKQEAFFASFPACFGLFKDLYAGQTTKEVARTWRLNSTQLFKILRLLEKQGLLDVLSENKVRFKIRGTIRMTHRGPLAKKLLRPQILAFLDHVDRVLENEDVCMHSAEVELNETHIAEFVEEIHQLGAKYRARAFRDKSLFPKGKLKSVRWLLAFAPFQTDWQPYKLP
jgi:transposase-like protein